MNLLSSLKRALLASLAVILNSQISWAFGNQGQWTPIDSKVEFKIFHFMHNAKGLSNKMSGSVDCADGSKCTYELFIPVMTFASRNEDRDKDMRIAIQSKDYPHVKLSGTGVVDDDSFKTNMKIDFAGSSHSLPLEFSLTSDWFKRVAKGKAQLKVSDFGIPLPSLLGMPIEDKLLIEFQVRFEKK